MFLQFEVHAYVFNMIEGEAAFSLSSAAHRHPQPARAAARAFDFLSVIF